MCSIILMIEHFLEVSKFWMTNSLTKVQVKQSMVNNVDQDLFVFHILSYLKNKSSLKKISNNNNKHKFS